MSGKSMALGCFHLRHHITSLLRQPRFKLGLQLGPFSLCLRITLHLERVLRRELGFHLRPDFLIVVSLKLELLLQLLGHKYRDLHQA